MDRRQSVCSSSAILMVFRFSANFRSMIVPANQAIELGPIQSNTAIDGTMISARASVVSGRTPQNTAASRISNRTINLSALRGKIQRLADAGEHIAFRDAACVSFVDRGPEYGEFRFVLPFFAFQHPQRGANDLAGILVAALFNPGCD